MFDAIIFDCDGVLVDSEVVGLEDTAAFLRTKGFDWQAADLVRIFTGLRDDVFAARLTSSYADILGRAPTEEEGTELFVNMVENRRRNRHTMQAVPHTKQMAEAIQHLPIKRAVASSTKAAYLEDKLKRFDLWAYFAPHAYSAEYVQDGKPAPDIFLYAADKIEVAPEKCLVIEDSVNGIKAGLAADMTVWGFSGGGHCFEGHSEMLEAAQADRVVASHHELLSELKKALML